MKNILIIDIDTERNPVVQLGKPSASDLPKNKDEAEATILMDMACICEGLSTLIHAADQSGYKPSHESLKDCITHLERSFVDTSYTTEILGDVDDKDNEDETPKK
jgi:hypothetical protein